MGNNARPVPLRWFGPGGSTPYYLYDGRQDFFIPGLLWLHLHDYLNGHFKRALSMFMGILKEDLAMLYRSFFGHATRGDTITNLDRFVDLLKDDSARTCDRQGVNDLTRLYRGTISVNDSITTRTNGTWKEGCVCVTLNGDNSFLSTILKN